MAEPHRIPGAPRAVTDHAAKRYIERFRPLVSHQRARQLLEAAILRAPSFVEHRPRDLDGAGQWIWCLNVEGEVVFVGVDVFGAVRTAMRGPWRCG